MAVPSVQSKVLGWIKPDDGVRVNGRFLDYECFRLEQWLLDRDIAGVRVAVETSTADSHHVAEDLLATGDGERLLGPARRLAEAGCHALCWACTSGSFIGGLAWARAQVETLATATGLLTTSTSLALVAATTHLGARTVDVLSPYPEPVTDALRSFLHECGLDVGHVRALDCPTGSDSHRLDLPREVARFGKSFPRSPYPLLIPDAAVNTLDLVAAFEAELDRPVITANQATLWQGFKMLGLAPSAEDAGTLFGGSCGATPL